jgi:hypothetical protein
MPYTTSNISGNLRVSGGFFEVLGTGIIPNLYAGRDVVLPAQVETRGLAGVYNVSLRYANQDSLEYALRNQKISLYSGTTSSGPWLPFSVVTSQNLHNATGFAAISSGTYFAGKIPGTTWFPKVLIEPLNLDQKIQKTYSSGLFALNTNDKIGIGLIAPTDKLHVRGNTRIEGDLSLNGTARVTGELISGKVLRGGENNSIFGMDTYGAMILGGSNHKNSGTFGVLVGGYQNQVMADSAVIVGGFFNTNSGKSSFLGGGSLNQILVQSGQSTENSTIVGGSSNIARGNFSTIVGGYNNQTYSDSSTAVGGINNYLTGNYATIAGGGYNRISGGCYNTIGGGECNLIGGNQSVIPGGHCNCASGFFLAVGGGGFNCTAGWFGTIAGGYHNDVGGPQIGLEDNEWFAKYGYASVLGGANNKACANSAVVLGGWCNCSEGYASLVGNGKKNQIVGYVGYYNSIINGKCNAIITHYPNPPTFNSGWLTGYDGDYTEHATIVDGDHNVILDSSFSTILNGWTNGIGSGGYFSTILGGVRNTLLSNNALNLVFGSGITVHSGMDNIVAIGGNHYVMHANSMSFNDYSKSVTETAAANMFHLDFINGLGMGGDGIKISDYASAKIQASINQNGQFMFFTGSTGLLETHVSRIFRGIREVDSRGLSLRALKDVYGRPVTGIKMEDASEYSLLPINIGQNIVDSFAVTPKYPLGTFWNAGMTTMTPANGERPITGLAELVRNPTIALGWQNKTSFSDIAIGIDNYHEYELNTTGANSQLSLLKSGIDRFKSKYNIFMGIGNYASGNGNVTVGYANTISYGGQTNLIYGSNNVQSPQRDISGRRYWAQELNIDGDLVAYIRNTAWSGMPANYNTTIGFKNFVESDQKSIVVGDNNEIFEARSTNAIGSTIINSGQRSNILGSIINNYGSCMNIIGGSSYFTNVFDSVAIGNRNLDDRASGYQTTTTSVIGTDNLFSAGHSVLVGSDNVLVRGKNSILIGAHNFNGSNLVNNTILGRYNWISGNDTKIIGTHNYVWDSANAIQIGNDNITNYSECGITLGDRNFTNRHRTINLGICTNSYNYGQISTSTDNGYGGPQGSMQKINLAWKGVTTGANQRQIYLDGIESPSLWQSGLATVPSGRIWNGTINIVAAETGLAEFKTWQKAITLYNKGNTAGGITIAGQDDIKVYSSSANVTNWGVMLSGNSANNGMGIHVTGANSKNIVWHIQGEFNDTKIPTRERLMSAKIVDQIKVPVIIQ